MINWQRKSCARQLWANKLGLRPKAPVARFDDLGHYPQIEDPDRVAEALQRAFSA